MTLYAGSGPGLAGMSGRAREIGSELADAEVGLVFGGGRVGLMGAVSAGALARGGDVIGVITESLLAAEIVHEGVFDMRVVVDLAERKRMLRDLGDAHIALPGGPGTVDELFESWTALQLGMHSKPVGVMNIGGYWDPLLTQIARMTDDGLLDPRFADAFVVAEEVGDLLAQIEDWSPPVAKWR